MLENETIDEVTQSKQVIDADNHAAASSAATQTPANAANSNTLTSNGLPPSPSFITPFIATDHQRLVFRFIGYHLKPIKMHELNFQNSQKKKNKFAAYQITRVGWSLITGVAASRCSIHSEPANF